MYADGLSVKGELEVAGMEGMTRQQQAGCELRGPAVAYEIEVARLIGAVYFVAEDGEAEEGKMGANLVHAAGDGEALHEREFRQIIVRRDAFQHAKQSAAAATVGVTGLAHADPGGGEGVHGSQRLGAACGIPQRPPTHDGQVAFPDEVVLHGTAQLASGGRIFGDEHETARFAIQAVDERHAAPASQFVGEELGYTAEQGGLVAAHAAGGVHDERRRFVDHQRICILVNYGKIGVDGNGKVTRHR